MTRTTGGIISVSGRCAADRITGRRQRLNAVARSGRLTGGKDGEGAKVPSGVVRIVVGVVTGGMKVSAVVTVNGGGAEAKGLMRALIGAGVKEVVNRLVEAGESEAGRASAVSIGGSA